LELPAPNLDELIRTAIEQRRLIRLVYRNKPRIVEPHDYGVHNGSVKLLGYQVGGSSTGRLPNWRWMEASLISEVLSAGQDLSGRAAKPLGKASSVGSAFRKSKIARKECKIARHAAMLTEIHRGCVTDLRAGGLVATL